MKKTYHTHAGIFHADEVMGYAITQLAKLCTSFVRSNEVPTRDKAIIIADKGGIYDPASNQYDHHQLDFESPQPELVRQNGLPFATAGLLWREYGREICGSQEVADRVDKSLIEGIDANDAAKDYKISATAASNDIRVMTLPAIISSFNSISPDDDMAQEEGFYQASIFTKQILINAINASEKYIEATQDFETHLSIKDDGKVLILEKYFPWQEIVEEKYPSGLMIIYPSLRGGYSLQMIPSKPGERDFRHTNGIERPGWFSGFIHAAKFIAGCNSIEEALSLARWNMG